MAGQQVSGGWGLIFGWGFGGRRGGPGLAEALYKFVEDLGAGAGDCVSGMGAGFHPGKEEKKRYPAARVVFELGADAIEDAGKIERQVNGGSLEGGWVEAVLGRRGDEVFAADEWADGMNGAGLILEEGTGDALVKVFEGQLAGGIGFGEPVFVDHAVDEAGGGEFEERLMEALGEFLLA